MKYDPEQHHRRSIRLQGYDYAQEGAYFVTIVTQDRPSLFGEIVDEKMRLNDGGATLERWWIELNNKFRTLETDEFVIMPNHFHGIIVIADVGADLRVGPVGKGAHIGAPLQRPPQPTTRTGAGVNPDVHPAHQGTHAGVPLQGTHPVRPVARRGAPMCAPGGVAGEAGFAHGRAPLPTIIQWFKTMTTNEYMRGVKTQGWTPFRGQLWQRNYYEHVVRDEESLNRIRQYILDNPASWEFDRENPAATSLEPENAWRG